MPKIVHVEITGDDSAALADFYARQFGFATAPSPFMPDYHLLSEGDRIVGATMPRAYQAQAVILWFEVEDLDAALAGIQAAGGSAAGERSTIPGQGLVQYARDPQGNVVGLKQPF